MLVRQFRREIRSRSEDTAIERGCDLPRGTLRAEGPLAFINSFDQILSCYFRYRTNGLKENLRSISKIFSATFVRKLHQSALVSFYPCFI